MIAVILAGGRGIRLWPESRKTHPKQLCKFVDDNCLLANTVERLLNTGFTHIAIITTEELSPLIKQVADESPARNSIEILTEPIGKNTAPAIGLALAKYNQEFPDSIIGIFPADHHIIDHAAFDRSISTAVKAALQGYLTTIGISPNRPETGFGYIRKMEQPIADLPGVFPTEAFYEKPDQASAQAYLDSGRYFWNAGIYIGQISTFIDEFANYLPDIHPMIMKGYDDYLLAYNNFPEISIDYGIAVKSKRMAVVTADCGWCDLGSWNAMAEIHPGDDHNNIQLSDDIILKDSQNCITMQKDKTLVLFGVENLLVIETNDVVLVTDRNKAADLKALVDHLAQANRKDLL